MTHSPMPPAGCPDVDTLVSARFQTFATLPVALRHHLETCDECRAEVEALWTLDADPAGAAAAAEGRMPEALWRRVQDAAAEAPAGLRVRLAISIAAAGAAWREAARDVVQAISPNLDIVALTAPVRGETGARGTTVHVTARDADGAATHDALIAVRDGRVRVTLQRGSEPCAGAVLQVRAREHGTVVARGRPDATGTWIAADLAAGEYDLDVEFDDDGA